MDADAPAEQVNESIARLERAVAAGEPRGTMLDATSDFTREDAHVALTVPFPAFLAAIATAGVPARDALRHWVRANGRFTDPDGRRYRLQNHVPGELTDTAIADLAAVATSVTEPSVVAHERDGWRVAPKKDPFSRW